MKGLLQYFIAAIPFVFVMGVILGLSYANIDYQEYSVCSYFDGQNVSWPQIINRTSEESFVLDHMKTAESIQCSKFTAYNIRFKNYESIVKVK